MVSSLRTHWMWPTFGTLLFWGVWAFLPKLALHSLEPHSVLLFEAVGSLIVALPLYIARRKIIQVDRRGIELTAIQVVVVVIATLSFLYALKTGPVSIIVTMTAMYPVVSVILARLFLREKINRTQFFAILMAVVAVYLLAA